MTVRTPNITILSHTPQQAPPANQFVPTQPRHSEATPKNLCQAWRCPCLPKRPLSSNPSTEKRFSLRHAQRFLSGIHLSLWLSPFCITPPQTLKTPSTLQTTFHE